MTGLDGPASRPRNAPTRHSLSKAAGTSRTHEIKDGGKALRVVDDANPFPPPPPLAFNQNRKTTFPRGNQGCVALILSVIAGNPCNAVLPGNATRFSFEPIATIARLRPKEGNARCRTGFRQRGDSRTESPVAGWIASAPVSVAAAINFSGREDAGCSEGLLRPLHRTSVRAGMTIRLGIDPDGTMQLPHVAAMRQAISPRLASEQA